MLFPPDAGEPSRGLGERVARNACVAVVAENQQQTRAKSVWAVAEVNHRAQSAYDAFRTTLTIVRVVDSCHGPPAAKHFLYGPSL